MRDVSVVFILAGRPPGELLELRRLGYRLVSTADCQGVGKVGDVETYIRGKFAIVRRRRAGQEAGRDVYDVGRGLGLPKVGSTWGLALMSRRRALCANRQQRQPARRPPAWGEAVDYNDAERGGVGRFLIRVRAEVGYEG